MKLSVVIPVMNEQDNVKPILDALEVSLKNISHEIIFVDDGSSDETKENILKSKAKHIKLLVFNRNYGQTSAMAAGIAEAEGEFIVTIDGDMQNDPKDIPVMLERIEKENLDVLMGVRKSRKDGVFLRKIPSIIANCLIRRSTKLKITDIGCTLKIFRSNIAKKLDLYGELHRFIPVLAHINGAKIDEMYVAHKKRHAGTSKYGINRVFKVVSDLMLMLFFVKYRQKPMHLFGTLGILGMMIGGTLLSILAVEKLMGHDIGTRPMFFIAILCITTSIQFITTGFIAELLMRTYYRSKNEKPYEIKEIYRAGQKK